MGNCGCTTKHAPEAPPQEEKKNYVCFQCNAFKEEDAGKPRPECCGKPMQEMD